MMIFPLSKSFAASTLRYADLRPYVLVFKVYAICPYVDAGIRNHILVLFAWRCFARLILNNLMRGLK